MRSNLITELYCAKHPNYRLELDFVKEADYDKKTGIGANSSSEINVRLHVVPCRECEHEFNIFRQSVKIIVEQTAEEEKNECN